MCNQCVWSAHKSVVFFTEKRKAPHVSLPLSSRLCVATTFPNIWYDSNLPFQITFLLVRLVLFFIFYCVVHLSLDLNPLIFFSSYATREKNTKTSLNKPYLQKHLSFSLVTSLRKKKKRSGTNLLFTNLFCFLSTFYYV